MNTETMRSSFENTYKHRPLGRFLAGDYKAASTQQLWMCWQTAMGVYKKDVEDNQVDKQIVVELPKIIEVKDQKYPYDVPSIYYLATEVITAIEAAGGMVKI